MDTLKAMYKDWPFFQTLLSNMDMVLAKSNIAIASRYTELVTDANLRHMVFNRIRTEWQASVDALWFASTTGPYAEKTAAPIVHAALRLDGAVPATRERSRCSPSSTASSARSRTLWTC